MINPNAQEVLEKIQAMRDWGKRHLPFYESVIANDLVIFLAIQFTSGKPLAVKKLFASLPYSYTAVRQHYKKLVEDGWVTHIPDKQDGRVKYIQPSEKFMDVIEKYVAAIDRAFPPPPR